MGSILYNLIEDVKKKKMINLEQTILRNILVNDQYMRKVLPFVKPDYFEGIYRTLFKEVGRFVNKYNKLPTLEAFKIEIDSSDKFNTETYTHALEILPNIFLKKKLISNGYMILQKNGVKTVQSITLLWKALV